MALLMALIVYVQLPRPKVTVSVKCLLRMGLNRQRGDGGLTPVTHVTLH